MSPNIWTQCAANFKPKRIAVDAIRIVESQHITSTRKLTDSDREQEFLEALIDEVKPPPPSDKVFAGLHYLLATPFRHPPLRHGSRFGTRFERGIWYGAKEAETAFAEIAYYRLVFLEGSRAALSPITTELTAFTASVRTTKGADLTREPFAQYERLLRSPTSYTATQALGAALRSAHIEAFLYRSARAPRAGTCVGLFAPTFATRSPSKLQPWISVADLEKVEFRKKAFGHRFKPAFAFPRSIFEVRGRIPHPSV